jgi:Zn finger protein HypA/HybF involved in hydrogenase expression
VAISVDGVERCRLEPVDPKKPPSVCHNCGYSLHGLPVENSEVRCPECGRHCSAILFDRPAGEDGIFVR